MRAFLDANVLFSASNTGSNISRLLQRLIQQGEVVTSEYALEEAGRNIHLKRPNWAEAFALLVPSIEVVTSVQFALPVELSDKDVPILCAAIRSNCDLLLTGDKRDFGHLYGETVLGVSVVSLLRVAELLKEKS